MSPGTDLVIMANRLPVRRTDDGWAISPGGLVTAVAPLLRERNGLWVGWTGAVDDDEPPFSHDGLNLHPVALTGEEIAGYYEGFSNSALWPLLHEAIRPAQFERSWWQNYVDVNARFAEVAAEAVSPGGRVWVHDYHLLLAPQMVRDLRPDVRIGFFLHTPFAPSEIMRRLPWREEIIDGVLGSDIIGFQTDEDATHFLGLVRKVSSIDEEKVDRRDIADTLEWQGREIHVGAHPISIDCESVGEIARSDATRRRMAELHAGLGRPRRILLGVDRLDYTKGIEARLEAYAELLREGEIDPMETVFVQVATPSRDDISGYAGVRRRVEQIVGEINGDFGSMGRQPVLYLHQTQTLEELVAMYQLADVMVITAFRDGMNLVAKEYVASRVADDGVLLLSEFTGSAVELEEAVRCNPYDIEGLKARILEALEMPPADQADRMRSLRARVAAHTVHDWAANFLEELT